MRTIARTGPLWILLLCAAPAGADELVFADGKRQEVEEVRDATCQQVSFKGSSGGPVQSRDASDLVRVIRVKGDTTIGLAMRYFGDANAPKAEEYFKKALSGKEPWPKPYAQFFLGELYASQGQTKEAIDAYGKVQGLQKDHFYAPWGLFKAAQLSSGAEATKFYDQLASGAFGDEWKDRGAFGKARLLLAAGKAKEAQPQFASIASRGKSAEIKLVARCAEAHCALLTGGKNDAKSKFESVLREKDATPQALGYAWRGLGQCIEDSQPEDAMVAYLRSLLLYPENPEARGAATQAAELSQKKGWKAEQRLRALASTPPRLDSYEGADKDVEVMRRCLQLVSASLVRVLAPKLAEKARDQDEKAGLEFMAADGLKAMATASNDQKLFQEYEKLLAELQKKYPKYSRSETAGIDAFQAARDQAIALVNQANDEPDEAKSKQLIDQARQKFTSTLKPFQDTIAAMTKEVDALTDKEAMGEITPEEQEKKQDVEFKRDLAEYLLAESYTAYANSFPEGDKTRQENLEKALKAYNDFVESRGSFFRLLWYAYIGRGEVLLSLQKYPDAIMQYEELVNIEPPFEPDNADGKKAMAELIKDIAIRAYYGLCRALNGSGKSAEAFDKVKNLDEDRRLAGWREHPMGILLTFEMAKSLAGAGQGSEGAEQIYAVVEKARRAPEAEKIPGLGMSRLGAGACRALSELSDQTGGEIYSPDIQYATGTGYFLRRRPELAISAFKSVLTACKTRDERAEWVPKAVWEIGQLLFTQERFLEAALAYETVFVEFPDHEKAAEAAKIALSAAKRACEQFKEDTTSSKAPVVLLYKRLVDKAQDLGGGFENLIIQEAADLQRKGNFVGAAQKYLEVKPESKDEKTGEVRKVKFYANAVANAGYCYFQAYKQSKDQKQLTLARENLQKAAKVAKELNDLDSQSLASYYLGQLESQLDPPRWEESLKALAPFDAELADTTKYIVRARRTQAEAYLQLGKLDEAEACFEKVKGRKSDPDYYVFAYNMAKGVRQIAVDRFKKKNDVQESRELRAKAGAYMKAWWDSTPKEQLKADHYWYAGSYLFAGGEWEAAADLYADGLKRFQRPELQPGKNNKEAGAEHESFDVATENLGYSLVMAGQYDQGFEVLKKLRDSVYICEEDGNKVGYGVYKDRQLGPKVRGKFQGREVERQFWYTVIELPDGKTVKYYDNAEPRAGNTEFVAALGTDAGPNPNATKADERRLILGMKRSYLLVDGMARATWAIYQAKKDDNFLANDVTDASNELRYLLRGMGDSSYQQLAANSQIEPVSYELRSWQADLDYLRIKMARQKWSEVVSDIKQMELLGKKPPAEIAGEFNEIKKQAEAKQ